MLHTIKEPGDGVVPVESWLPTVRRPLLHGFSAEAWQRFSSLSLLAFFLTLGLMVGVAIAGSRAAGAADFALVFYWLVVLAGLVAAFSGAFSTYKARREYRHGYTTLQDFSKFGLYYRTLPQLDPRSGVEVRAAGEPKLALPELKIRLAACRAGYGHPERMSRHDAAEAAATAGAVNETNLELARAKSIRARLIKSFGAAAGNMRADARNYAFAAALTAGGGLPALILGVEGTSATRNPLWIVPAIVLALIIAVLSLIARQKTEHATRLAADFLGVAPNDLPPWTGIRAPRTARSVRPPAG